MGWGRGAFLYLFMDSLVNTWVISEDKTYLLEEASAGKHHAPSLPIAASSSSISTPLSPA